MNSGNSCFCHSLADSQPFNVLTFLISCYMWIFKKSCCFVVANRLMRAMIFFFFHVAFHIFGLFCCEMSEGYEQLWINYFFSGAHVAAWTAHLLPVTFKSTRSHSDSGCGCQAEGGLIIQPGCAAWPRWAPPALRAKPPVKVVSVGWVRTSLTSSDKTNNIT